MMVISTLPPPPNALQCQEASGQLLPCSYPTQNLSNGELIVAITVYVQASYASQVNVAVELNGFGKAYRYESSAIQILNQERHLSFRRATKPKHNSVIRYGKI